MLFKSYTPSNSEVKNLNRLYGYLKRTSGKDNPTKADYYSYRINKAGLNNQLAIARGYEKLGLEEEAENLYSRIDTCLTTFNFPTWEEIKRAITRKLPESNQNVVYIILFSNGGIKCGQTNNLVQRYYSITREKGTIASTMYLPLENKAQALAAENALQNIFGHSKGMKKVLGKMDYFDCEPGYAESFISNNKREIYNSIMEAIEGV